MNEVLQPIMCKFVLVFSDNILIYGPTLEAHANHLRQVLAMLQQHILFHKASKCSFGQSKLEYLGHIISDKGVSTDPSKIAAMLYWPVPSSFTELGGFLGLTGYYRHFVKHYGIFAKPLTELLKHKTFHCTHLAKLAFRKLKQALTTTLVLALQTSTPHL